MLIVNVHSCVAYVFISPLTPSQPPPTTIENNFVKLLTIYNNYKSNGSIVYTLFK